MNSAASHVNLIKCVSRMKSARKSFIGRGRSGRLEDYQRDWEQSKTVFNSAMLKFPILIQMTKILHEVVCLVQNVVSKGHKKI